MSIKSIVIKTVAGILGVAILIGVVLWLKEGKLQGDSENASDTTEAAIEVYKRDSANDSVRIDVLSENGFALLKENGEWAMEGMEGIKVRRAYAEALLKSVTDISSPMLADEDCEDLSAFGLVDAKNSVRVSYPDGETMIDIGNESGDYYYVALRGENDVYIVSKNDLSMVFTDKMRFLDTYVTNVDINQLVGVEYGNVSIKKDGNYWLEEKPYSRLADDEVVKTKILSFVTSINADDIVKAEKAVLGDKKSVKLTLSQGEEIEFCVYEKDARESYVTYGDAKYAYVVKNTSLAFLDVTGFELMTKYVAPIAIGDVRKIELVSQSGRRVIEIASAGSDNPRFYLDGEAVTEKSARAFYARLVGLLFKAEGVSEGEAEYEIIITHTDNARTTMNFLPYSQTDYAVKLNGKTEFTVTRKSVTDLFAALREIEKK